MDLQQSANLAFMALALWREARGEPSAAKLAVAFSILNRVIHPAWWGDSVMAVLFKKWQYSSLTSPHDPNLVSWPDNPNDPVWKDCLMQAQAALVGAIANPVPGADSYFDISIPPPSWAMAARYVGQIGRLKFYDVRKDYERSAVPAP